MIMIILIHYDLGFDESWSQRSILIIIIIQMHPGFDVSLQEGRAITLFCPEKEWFSALKNGVDVDQR